MSTLQQHGKKMMTVVALLIGMLVVTVGMAAEYLAKNTSSTPTGHPASQQKGFNVREYGAVGDDRTDNTAAFSKCLEAIIAAGGGRMYLPDGIGDVQDLP